jgi:hypothetical protein
MDIPLKPDRKEEINSDVYELRHEMMIMRKSSVNDLKTWLTEILDLYNTKTDRLMLYNEIMKLNTLKLNTPKIIDDVYYLDTIQPFFKHIQYLIRKDLQNLDQPAVSEKKHLLSIPTNAKPDEILIFWLKLQGNNEKGEPYWNSRQEIEYFVNQNFEGFPGVDEIKEFTPNMNKSEMYQVAWTFLRRYGKYKTKRQYENLLLNNFTQFRNTKNVYSNIKDHSKDHLRRITK